MPWWGTALGLAVVGLFVSAGFWQLGRAAEKRALLRDFAAGDAGPPIASLLTDPDAARQRFGRLRVEGAYDGSHQVLLDNMIADGRPGYQVLTPLRTATGVVLVNRGWVPAPGMRDELPDVAVTPGTRTVIGRIDRLPRPGLRLAGTPPAAHAPWPRRLLFPTAAELGAELGYPVREYQLLLDRDEPEGYRRDWQPAEMGPERHLGYAVQWFGMATAVIVIYVVLARRKNGTD